MCNNKLSSWYFERDGHLYCRQDYMAKFGEACNGCAQIITGPVMVSRYTHKPGTYNKRGQYSPWFGKDPKLENMCKTNGRCWTKVKCINKRVHGCRRIQAWMSLWQMKCIFGCSCGCWPCVDTLAVSIAVGDTAKTNLVQSDSALRIINMYLQHSPLTLVCLPNAS